MTGEVAIRHSTVAEKIQYAKAMAESNLLPRHYQRQPANLLIALEYAEAFGIAPINAITSVFVVDGKPSASADLIAAMVRRAGHKLRVTGDDTHAVAELIRADDPDFTYRAEWNLDKAKQAGLIGKGTWKAYPGALLRARAITEVARMGASDALFGVIYTPEEIGADVNEDGLPVTETVSAREVSGRDWLAEAEQMPTVDTLRDLWHECKAWGELTDDIKQHMTALVEAKQLVEQADAAQVEDAVVVSDEQGTLDVADPWTTPAEAAS
jgi:hypothetical protein